MKRALAALLSATLLSGVMAVPATAGPVVCDQKAMRTILNLGYGVFGTPYVRCTFRLFAPAGRQAAVLSTPAWTEAEYFHGGNFIEVLPETIAENGWRLADIKNYYAQIEQHLFWGDANRPASQVELTLRRGPISEVTEVQSIEWGLPAGTFLQETYFDVPPQAPSTYEWRYTYDDAIVFGFRSTVSHVTINPA